MLLIVLSCIDFNFTFVYNMFYEVYVMKKLLSIILLFCCCMLFVGCTAKENAKTTTATNGNDTSSVTENVGMQQPELPQKHTISLTMNNYSTYIETSIVAYLSSTPQKVEFTANGCLSYAYYENVVFEIEHDGQKMYVTCNAAGNGKGSYGGRTIGTITAISGTVIYWI